MRLRPGVVAWQEVDDEIVGLDERSAQYFAVSKTGTCLWRELAEGATPERLVDLLVESYAIDETRAKQDVERFVASLRASDLLEE